MRLRRAEEEARVLGDHSRATDCRVLLRRHAAECPGARTPLAGGGRRGVR
ncbi:hypothetical protein V1J52_15540 [Streptomyces sp. TRM 70351]|nr:hypothetical protein [Streptomyces sp. TRM 70351]MEE1929581.1 hypothetical protein [Streptomyces sp. TRM 70351]